MSIDPKNIVVDYSRDELFDTLGLTRLREGYMREEESSPQDRFAYVAAMFATNLAHGQRIYDYASKHWFSFSTPVLSFGRGKSLPISCFLNYLDDSREGLVNTLSETNWLSMLGGGVGVHIGIRASDDKSVGIMPHLRTYDTSSIAYRQSRTRRGSYAMYLDISHPDIKMFIDMRKPTGDINMRALNLHHGINVTDSFMRKVEALMLDSEADDSWELVDPNSGEVREVVSVKELWQSILETRMLTGEPYIHYIDTSNEALPVHLKNLGLRINGSNLCQEIVLPTSKERTAVCCLSSLNLEYYDQWSGRDLFFRDIGEFLDNVLQHFIDNAPDEVARARFSAERERSIGVGALGFHAWLQKNNIPWESAMAVSWNHKMFKNIRSQMNRVNLELGTERGEAPDAIGTGMRFSHLMAVAPNASTSIIMGNTSPSIEPWRANAYRQDTLSGSFLNKNKYLQRLLESFGRDDLDEIWSSIIVHDGSVQHLDFLTDLQKQVFKTSMEIDQRWVIQHASDRQQYIDQGQSVNVFFRPDSNVKYIHAVHFAAWKQGLKGLYYCRSEKAAKADKVGKKVERDVLKTITTESMVGEICLACEG